MSSIQKAVEQLTAAIDEAQTVLQQLRNSVTPEGWSNTRPGGGEPDPKSAPRHGCEWNTRESRDLMRKWLQLTPVDVLASLHRRTPGSVRSQMQRLLLSANHEVLLDEICGRE